MHFGAVAVAALAAALGRQPEHMVRIFAWDRGTEMARWAGLEAALGIEVYCRDPH